MTQKKENFNSSSSKKSSHTSPWKSLHTLQTVVSRANDFQNEPNASFAHRRNEGGGPRHTAGWARGGVGERWRGETGSGAGVSPQPSASASESEVGAGRGRGGDGAKAHTPREKKSTKPLIFLGWRWVRVWRRGV